MGSQRELEFYLDTMVREGSHKNKDNLRFQMDTLLGKVDFENKKVLDIGGGCGLCSFYAACRGARKVVCLEPEDEGSSSRVIETFRKLQAAFAFENVQLQPITLQEFEPGGETFDVVLLHNSINHLDENACINLLHDERSRAIYQGLLSKIASLSAKGAKLIICDCSRYNFFALLKVRNPLVPNIEWHKHQSPRVWVDLLSRVGFVNPRIRWSSFNSLRRWGKVLTGNKAAAFFLAGHFCLTMEKGGQARLLGFFPFRQENRKQ